MANRTVKDAHTIHGTNPQYLVEKIIRSRIYECKYWKEECFAVTAELIVDKGMELRYCGGVYGGNIKPTPFICLLLKMLQIQPEKDIIIEFLRQDNFKYIRALAAIYLRLTASAVDIFKYLEPLYNDYRKLRLQTRDGSFTITTLDQFVDELLNEERVCDIIMPRLQKRHVLEEQSELEPRVSLLEDDNDEDDEEEEEDERMEQKIQKIRKDEDLLDRRKNREEKIQKERERKRRERSHSRERTMKKRRSRSRDRSRDRENRRHRDDRREIRREDRRDRHEKDNRRERRRSPDRNSHHRRR